MTRSQPARGFNAPFVAHPSRPVLVLYQFRFDFNNGAAGQVELRSDPFSPPTTVVAVAEQFLSGAIGATLQTVHTLVALIFPGAFVEVATVTFAGGPVFTFLGATEVVL